VEPDPEIRKIEIGQETLKNLNTLRKWSMFLAISGFIFIGLIIALGLLAGTFLAAFNLSDKTKDIPDILVFTAFMGFALINFFPILFLFRFSKHTSFAVSTLDRKEMHKAIMYLKRYFVYMGVLLIVAVTVYLAGVIIVGRSAALFQGL
jgi:hypothetical protein